MTEIKVHKTTDHSKFRFLEENRAITDGRVKKIMQSIERVGYVLSPILVNEKYEIIDGQGRFVALRKLGLPQYYIMQKGIGIEECRQMNINQSNWTQLDYIGSYAKGGNANYQRLQSLIDTSTLEYGVVVKITTKALTATGQDRTLVEGRLKLTEKDKERARWVIGYVEKFKDDAKRIGGKKVYFYLALAYAYRHLDIEQHNRLEEIVKRNVFNFPPFASVVEYLRYFDKYYNEGKRSKKNKINLEMEYRMENEIA